jgi:hypothetical protein
VKASEDDNTLRQQFQEESKSFAFATTEGQQTFGADDVDKAAETP